MLEESRRLIAMGFLPFPGEREKEYRERAYTTIERHKRFQQKSRSEPKDRVVEGEGALCSFFSSRWGVYPSWATLLFSRTAMSPFHLGALCEELFEGSSLFFIQIHSRLFFRKSFWRYKRELIFAHEMIHLLRLGLGGSSFEEFVAYDSDPACLARFFGPFFSSSWMPALFVAQLWAVFLALVGFFEQELLLPWIFFIEASPAFFLLFKWISISSLLPWIFFLRKSLLWRSFQNKIKRSRWSKQRSSLTLMLHEKEIYAFANKKLSDWPAHVESLADDLYGENLREQMKLL